MKRTKSIIWGIALVILGLILGGNALKLFDIDIFFDGWWTLFIIIPSLIGLISDDNKLSNFIVLVVGISLLLSCQNIVDFDVAWKLILPVIIICFGLSLIFKGNSFKYAPKVCGNHVNSIFSGHEIKIDDEFKGTNLCSVFGGIELDLRKAKIDKDVTINACSIFGGVDIYVPSNVKVKVKSTSVFGGVDNNQDDNIEKEHTIYLNATCVFGAVDIK